MKYNFYLTLVMSLLFSASALGQGRMISGVVTDAATGESLPGVNVLEEGTLNGTVTNFDGQYTLTVSEGAKFLVFSFIGMEVQTIPIERQTEINVQLSADVTEVEEVMVVAYGTTTKEAYTGAAQTVRKEIIQDRPTSSVAKSLQGTTAGLQVSSSSGQPGSSPAIRIRGIGSLSAGSSPLFVVDGVPIAGGLNDINPNDIESLTVLKDAAASSLYGSRAANGVIIVTTKSGQEGKTQISFNFQTGVNTNISEGYRLMNSTQFYEQSWLGLYNQALYVDDLTVEQARQFAHDNVQGTVGFNPFDIDQPLDDNGKLIPGTQLNTNTDWRDQVYKTGIVQNYNMNVAGGTQSTKVYFSLGYFSDSGTVLASDYERFTSKLNVSHKVNDFISAGMNTQLTYSRSNVLPAGTAGANPVRAAQIINAASPVKNGDGTYNFENKSVFDFNPVALAEMDIRRGTGMRNLTSAFLNLRFHRNLSFRTTGSMDYSSGKSLTYLNPEHGDGKAVNGRSTETATEFRAWNISNILTWSKKMNSSSIEVLAGQEAIGEKSTALSAGVTDFAIPGKPELVWGADPETPASSVSEMRMLSFLSQAKYNYGGKYYLSASLRGDGSSRFGEDNRFGLFYSVGGSWRMSEEAFMGGINWLNNLKLRASYGTSGNNNIGNYASLGLYSGGFNYGGYPGLGASQLPNPLIQWEKITSTNIGLESQLFKHFGATVEFYHRQSDGLLYNEGLSSLFGFTSITTNLGGMQNTGVEATLSYDILRKRALKYDVSLNMSTNKNEILDLKTDRVLTGTKILEPGGDIYQFYMREWAGVNPNNGRPMWYTNAEQDDKESSEQPDSAFEDPLGSGKMVTSEYGDAERKRMGSASPKVFGGFTNNLAYRNWDLSFYFYYSLGGKIYNNDYISNMHDGSSPADNLALEALNSWTPENRYTDVPRYLKSNQDQGNATSSRFIEDGSYLRLKNISLAYNLNPDWTRKYGIDNLRLFMSAENVWTLTSFKGYDPEVALSGTTNGYIPGVKSITFGLKVNL
ncbi:SusC/RagA family TonB-linked outer membrane protein [Carboxylicivirga sp. RSCT41]|uniref:SusC/RagA family TonB-linked outer membrane protein n=1 Tax=Carboxylicivirga agarovorans TaxID=3417570 RepID=UPI003D32C7E9